MLGRLGSGVALASMAALVLVGCSPGPSEDERIALARAAWDRFLSVLVEFGANPETATREGLLEVSTPAVADGQLPNFERAAESDIHAEGTRATTAFVPVAADEAGRTFDVNVCVDLSDERVIAADGSDITDENRPETASFSVTLAEGGAGMVVSAYSAFEGPSEQDPCR